MVANLKSVITIFGESTLGKANSSSLHPKSINGCWYVIIVICDIPYLLFASQCIVAMVYDVKLVEQPLFSISWL